MKEKMEIEKRKTSHYDLKEHEEKARDKRQLNDLLKYNVLYTPPERDFDDIAELAKTVCDCPYSNIVFLDLEKRNIFFKAIAANEDVEELPRVMPLWSLDMASLSNSELWNGERLRIVTDTSKDSRFDDAPDIVKRFKFHASVPVVTSSGIKVGSLVVMDFEPRNLNDSQRMSLIRLSRQVKHLLELRLRLNELNEVNTEKNNFMAMISHDIRQPLGNIMLSCELISQDSAQNTDLIQTIHSSASLMHHLVDDLLQMVQFDLGRLEIKMDKRPADIALLMHRVVQMNTLIAGKKNISLCYGIIEKNSAGLCASTPFTEWQTRRHSLSANIDAVKMEQVLNNLVSNAIKFSFPGSMVGLRIEHNTADKTLEISVIDHGQGIPPEDLQNMFRPFQRLSVKPTAGESSTGFGLWVVKSVVEAHSGNIRVNSAVGVGTTFKIVLPMGTLRDSVEKTFDMRQSLERATTIAQIKKTPSQLRVLIADDNTVNQKLMTQVITKRGHIVDVAGDGEEALSMFIENGGHAGFDILLLDEEMPRMNGIDVVKKIRQLEEENKSLNRIPIISISGHARAEHIQWAKTLGVDECIPKPFRMNTLLSTLELFAHKPDVRPEGISVK
jgi:signal transduction histidine kinase/ActR/RegA family two-component response regulator